MERVTTPSPARANERDPGAPAGPVLLAVGGVTGGNATPVAARLVADRLGTDVQALTVVEPPGVNAITFGALPIPQQLLDAERDAALESARERLRAEAAGRQPWPVEAIFGSVARTITEEARARRAGMIVVGVGRHGAVDRVLGGETALQVVRLADRPVLVVADGFAGSFRHIVVATDFSPASVAAARAAAPLAEPRATVWVVHVRSATTTSGPVIAEWSAAYERRAEERFERLCAELRLPPGVATRYLGCVGDPAEGVLAFARRQSADLVVAGRHGYGFVERLFTGSVTNALVRRAGCSVLVGTEPGPAEAAEIDRALTGEVRSEERAAWPALLEQFTERNRGRRTRLEVDDPSLGAQAQERGYALLGASYDRRDGRVEIMLGDPEQRTRHLTRGIEGATSIGILTDRDGRDRVLRVEQGRAQTLLTLD